MKYYLLVENETGRPLATEETFEECRRVMGKLDNCEEFMSCTKVETEHQKYWRFEGARAMFTIFEVEEDF